MRVGVVLLILTILAAPFAVEAQPAGKVPRVGFLGGVPRSDPGFRAFEERLRKLGYVDGRSIAIEFRTSAGNLDLLPGLAAEPVRLNDDLLVASSHRLDRALVDLNARFDHLAEQSGLNVVA